MAAKIDWEKARERRFKLIRDETNEGLKAKFNGRCKECGLPLQRGDRILPGPKGAHHADCGDAYLKASRGK